MHSRFVSLTKQFEMREVSRICKIVRNSYAVWMQFDK